MEAEGETSGSRAVVKVTRSLGNRTGKILLLMISDAAIYLLCSISQ